MAETKASEAPAQSQTPPAAPKRPTSHREGNIPADLLKLVQRPVTDSKGQIVMEGSGDKARPKMRAIRPSEVFGWSSRHEIVTVVTTDGQKYTAERPSR